MSQVPTVVINVTETCLDWGDPRPIPLKQVFSYCDQNRLPNGISVQVNDSDGSVTLICCHRSVVHFRWRGHEETRLRFKRTPNGMVDIFAVLPSEVRG